MWKDVLKKNAVSITCGVIALVAVIASFWPADGWIEELKAGLDARKTVSNSMEGLLKKTRAMPNLDPSATTPLPLPRFPSEAVIKAGAAATKEMKDISQRLYEAAIKVNVHELLVPGSLPRSRDNEKLMFRGAYGQTFRLRADDQNPQLPDSNIPVSILNATQPPLPEEILAAQDKLWTDKYVSKIITVNGTPANVEQVSNDYVTEAMTLPDLMKQEKARTFSIYMLPGALTEVAGIEGGGVPTEDDIWSAQLGVWIQQDVARAIAATNESADGSVGGTSAAAPTTQSVAGAAPTALTGILRSPVKQLVRLDVPQGPAGTFTPGAIRPGAMGMPGGAGDEAGVAAGVVSDPTAVLTYDFTGSPTGRVPNGLYDIYPFVLTVDVDAAKLPQLLTELTRDRYLAVHAIDMTPVDLVQMQGEGFFYGSKPVVRAVVRAELLMLRKWSEPLMPPNVKKGLNIADAPPAAAAMVR